MRINPDREGFNSTTTGANGVGPTAGNVYALIWSIFLGNNVYTPISQAFPTHPGNFTYKVEGTPVHEPGTAIVLVLGMGWLGRGSARK